MKTTLRLFVCLLLIASISCTHHRKKTLPSIKWVLSDTCYKSTPDSLPFRFLYAQRSQLSTKKNKKGEYFINIHYPDLKAQLYCTWHRITSKQLYQFTEDAHRMAFQHTDVATAINEQLYANKKRKSYGIIFTLEGKVATPLQIALTDSSHYFFNASLYFNQSSNSDSLKPIVNYIHRDIIKLMDSFELNPNAKK